MALDFRNSDAKFCMALSNFAYERNEAVLRAGLSKLGLVLKDKLDEAVPLGAIFKALKTDTQAFFAEGKDRFYIAFRGSEAKLSDWATDFLIDRDPEKMANGDELHQGFFRALNGDQARAKIDAWTAAAGGKPILVTGHSLGGALAAMLTVTRSRAVTACYTFGQPRIGLIAPKVETPIFRIINKADVVPRVPVDFTKLLRDAIPDALEGLLGDLIDTAAGGAIKEVTYNHVGTAYVFTEDGSLVKNGEDSYLKFLSKSAAADVVSLWRALKKGGSFNYTGNLIADHKQKSYMTSLGKLPPG